MKKRYLLVVLFDLVVFGSMFYYVEWAEQWERYLQMGWYRSTLDLLMVSYLVLFLFALVVGLVVYIDFVIIGKPLFQDRTLETTTHNYIGPPLPPFGGMHGLF